MPHNSRPRRIAAVLLAALVGAFVLAGCSSDSGSEKAAGGSAESEASFPVSFKNADGTTTEIEKKPERILSTSTSITGTLLAIDAPVVASASDAKGNFFKQWAKVAEERKVTNAWPVEAVNIEAAYAAKPDLIIVSTSGADSAMNQLAELQQVAPVIVLDYSKQTWQDLATQLGEATGLQDQAKKTVDEYNKYVADAAKKITVPEGTANIVAYNGPTDNNPIGMGSGPHADVLKELGFKIEEPDPAWHTIPQKRSDFVFAAYENLTQLKSPTTFVLAVDNAGTSKMTSDPVLANLPSVKSGQVYGLGPNSFRVDYYSAKEIVDGVVANLGE